MRSREDSLMLAGMVAMFTAGGKARVVDCTINGFCRTSIYEFAEANVEPGEEVKPRTIWNESHFRATIVSDPATFLENSTFSPHYARNCALRHDIGEKLKELRKKNNGRRDRLFVVMEEYRKIDRVRMSKGECLSIDEEMVRGGASGNESIIALRSKDGAWPEDGADIVSENLVLAAIKIEQNVTYGMKALIASVNFIECNGNIVHIQEGYAELAFGALRAERKLNGEALDDKAENLRSKISKLAEITRLPATSELVTALRLEDTRDKSLLCLWYLRLWEASCKAGQLIGEPQFGNPDGIKVGQDGRRRQLEHRNDVAHGRVDEIDYVIFDRLQQDVLDLLRKNVLGGRKGTRRGPDRIQGGE